MLAADAEAAAAAEPDGAVRLLPAFDQYVVAAPRGDDDVVPAAERARVYRPQGWLSPVLLVDGRIAGVWSHERAGDRLVVEVEPFARLSRAEKAGVEAEAEALAALPRRRARAEPVIGWSTWHDSRSPTSAADRPARRARWPASSSRAPTSPDPRSC